MALAIAQKPESLSPFQHAEDQTQEKTSLILREIFVIGIPLMATNDLNQVFIDSKGYDYKHVFGRDLHEGV